MCCEPSVGYRRDQVLRYRPAGRCQCGDSETGGGPRLDPTLPRSGAGSTGLLIHTTVPAEGEARLHGIGRRSGTGEAITIHAFTDGPLDHRDPSPVSVLPSRSSAGRVTAGRRRAMGLLTVSEGRARDGSRLDRRSGAAATRRRRYRTYRSVT